MARALLLLIGGRQVPNLLTAQHLRPDIIVPVASYEALQPGDVWEKIKPTLQQLCPDGLAEPLPVDAFDLEQVRTACRRSLDLHAEWIFNVTCATTIMSIGAYEIAQQCGASAWYLDTATRRVVTLAGRPPESDLYRMTVAEYMTAYGRTIEEIGQEPELPKITFARYLARHPSQAMTFRNALRGAGADQVKRSQEKNIVVKLSSQWVLQLCEAARSAKLLLGYERMSGGSIRCDLQGTHLWNFMNGLWLETYAWASAQAASCFDDCRYGLRIPGESGRNELDLAATYAASLVIIECKTDDGIFKKPEYLYKLDSIAGMVGGRFVGRVFISSQSKPSDPDQLKSYDSFCDQARARQVVVVTGEHLEELSSILKREAGADTRQRPTYTRG